MDAERYARYLATAHWARTRAERMQACRGVCEVCLRRPATEVHHVTYARLGCEWPDDLVACCHHCHVLAPSHGETVTGVTRDSHA